MTDLNPLGRKGIVLAGGTGSRLFPITKAVSKQLLPVYDKPMVYYPISTLMLAGITEMLVITTPDDADAFQRLLGDGSAWGVRFTYAVQETPAGLAQAYTIADDFLAGNPSVLILGDNLFYGSGFSEQLQERSASQRGCLFAQQVADPERYGVVAFDDSGNPTTIVEKPATPPSNWAVTGLYFLPADAPAAAATLTPSARGELEIADLNQIYLDRQELDVARLDRGFAWLDTGTFNSMVEASEFVRVIEARQRLKIGSPEEVAFRMGHISASDLAALAEPLKASGYGDYLAALANG